LIWFDIWLRMMNMNKVICIGYFVAGYQKNNDVFLHWQHREKCPEAIKTCNNRCANWIYVIPVSLSYIIMYYKIKKDFFSNLCTCLEIWIYESRSTLNTNVFVLLRHPLQLIWQCHGMEVQYSVEYRWLKWKAPSQMWLLLSDLIQMQQVRYQSRIS
jgi:hypothetical protein